MVNTIQVRGGVGQGGYPTQALGMAGQGVPSPSLGHWLVG